ncbi:porin [Sulfitobacter sp.]|uniref:porin n=1 Tax=Sulfitobacter sp. TaxID=1903071 RepID=UPI00329A4FD0
MKKVLFASTALVATAFAAPNFASAQSVSAGNADISFGGYARWGVGYNEDRDEETIIISRFRLNINASVETDNGLRFAATVRGQADENSDGTAGTFEFGGARYQVSTGGLRVRVGNISGVYDDATGFAHFDGDLGLEGTIGISDTFGFPGAAFGNGAGDNGILVNYAIGDFTVAGSYVDESGIDGGLGTDDEWQVGATYTFGDYTVGALYGDDQDDEFWLVTVGGSVGAFGFAALIGENDANVDDNDNGEGDIAYGLTVNYEFGAATTVLASFAGGGDADSEAFGVGFVHSLGAGTTLRGMVGQDTDDSVKADLGVRFDF